MIYADGSQIGLHTHTSIVFIRFAIPTHIFLIVLLARIYYSIEQKAHLKAVVHVLDAAFSKT